MKLPVIILLAMLCSGPFALADELTPEARAVVAMISGTPFEKKVVWSGSSRPPSRLDRLKPEERAQTAELDAPVTVELLGRGRSMEGLEDAADRIEIIDVRVTNPNPYPLFFRGRHYRDHKTIAARWNRREGDGWKRVGWDWCGTGIRDWDLPAGGSLDLMLIAHRQYGRQQILGMFYRADKPSVRSECLLYESPEAPAP